MVILRGYRLFDFHAQFVQYSGRKLRHARIFHVPRPGQLDIELAADGARPVSHKYHAAAQTHGLAHIVSDKPHFSRQALHLVVDEALR
jgi:hypothetical protein